MHLFQTATIAILFHACLLPGADFFPLKNGNKWTYRDGATGETFSIRVGEPVAIAGQTYYKLTGYTEPELLVRVEETYGQLVKWDETLNQEVLLTSFEPFEGGYWLAPSRPCPEEVGQTQVKRGNHDGPAGPISDVLEMRYIAVGCADVGPVREQYAEHLGMLRRVQDSIAGPRTFDLVSAKVGNLTIDAAPNAEFTVSAGPAGSNGVPATFRLQVNSSSPLILSFSSGQEFEFTLNDRDGNTLWTWSADRTFIQFLHQRTVLDEWSGTVEIPWPVAPDGGLQPGDYTIRAFITATGGTSFSATLPVTIPPRQ
jgi:hypothetical protein